MDYSSVADYNIALVPLSRVDSTNLYAKREADALFGASPSPDMVVVSADEQTAGRGQRGTVWNSAVGTNLLFSLLVRPACLPVAESYSLSVVAALALHSAMQSFGLDPLIKWPNDIYCEGGKLAGILVESDFQGAHVSQAIVGIGLNVNQKDFEAMSRKPISMSMIAGHDFDRDTVLARVVTEFARYYRMLEQDDTEQLFTRYYSALMWRNEPALYRDACGDFYAVIEAVHRDGRLVLKRADGTLSAYSFKEVTVVSLGY